MRRSAPCSKPRCTASSYTNPIRRRCAQGRTHGLAADPGALQGLLSRESLWRLNAMAQGRPAVMERPIRRGMARQGVSNEHHGCCGGDARAHCVNDRDPVITAWRTRRHWRGCGRGRKAAMGALQAARGVLERLLCRWPLQMKAHRLWRAPA
jgi:hypothetical protein